MESLRETAVLTLASEKLDAARDRHRAEQAEELVSKYSRRAVIGALAAVAPGSDLVIQGVLATRLIRELSKLVRRTGERDRNRIISRTRRWQDEKHDGPDTGHRRQCVQGFSRA